MLAAHQHAEARGKEAIEERAKQRQPECAQPADERADDAAPRLSRLRLQRAAEIGADVVDKRRRMPELLRLVHELDPAAIYTVTDVKSCHGEDVHALDAGATRGFALRFKRK